MDAWLMRFFMQNILLVLLLAMAMQGCSRYDYHPRGVHKDAKVKPGEAKTKTYIVKSGDTLYNISKRYKMDYKVLAKVNNLRRPYTIYVGQRLIVSGNAVATYKPAKPTPTKTGNKAPPKYKSYPTASYSKTKLIWPAKGRLSSKFGPRKSRMHDGLDIANVQGTRVIAAAAGTVVHSNSKLSGYGNLVIIRHASDLFTAYAHNQRNLVKLGDKVSQGQLIAYMGSTGRSSGSHVHFEVRRGETAVDPMAYLPKR